MHGATGTHHGSPGSVEPHDRGERQRRRSYCSYSLKKVYSRNSSRLFSQVRAEASLCYDGAIIMTLFMASQYCCVFA